MVSSRIPEEKGDLLQIVRKRRGIRTTSEIVEAAIDLLLVTEGLMKDAA